MEYICPKCGFDLKQKLLKSKYTHLNKHDLLAIYSTPACPGCGSSLYQIASKIDKGAFTYFLLIILLFIISAVALSSIGYNINPFHIIIPGAILFTLFIAYFSWIRSLKLKGKAHYSANKCSYKQINADHQPHV